jgi:hypothetical protein
MNADEAQMNAERAIEGFAPKPVSPPAIGLIHLR